MQLTIQPGVYVLAVSGGVDSMALLHMLNQLKNQSGEVKPKYRLIVAHFDHGIREDSHLDRQLVQDIATEYGLPFVFHEGRLGPTASEAKARQARYEFLHKVRQAAGADAIITAHHQDDLVETGILNLLRGTGRKGLSSLSSRPDVHRPLLHIPKAKLQQYAKNNGLKWREDSTNKDVRYRRNYVRNVLLPRFSKEQKDEFIQQLAKVRELNQQIDTHLHNHLKKQPTSTKLNKLSFIRLSHFEAREVMAAWLRHNGIRKFDKKLIEKLVVAAKTYEPGKKSNIDKHHSMLIGKTYLTLAVQEKG